MCDHSNAAIHTLHQEASIVAALISLAVFITDKNTSWHSSLCDLSPQDEHLYAIKSNWFACHSSNARVAACFCNPFSLSLSHMFDIEDCRHSTFTKTSIRHSWLWCLWCVCIMKIFHRHRIDNYLIHSSTSISPLLTRPFNYREFFTAIMHGRIIQFIAINFYHYFLLHYQYLFLVCWDYVSEISKIFFLGFT